MRVSSKSAVLRWLLALALCPAVLTARGREATPDTSTGASSLVQTRADGVRALPAIDQGTVEENEDALVAAALAHDETARARVPFCPEGEKVKCTLGPPPVCHCE
jgi:hypothetical protein